MTGRFDTQSSLLTAFGVLIALVAVVGTRVLGWEWGTEQLAPTVIGVLVAGIAVLVFVRRSS